MASTSETTPLLGEPSNTEITSPVTHDEPANEDTSQLPSHAHFKQPRKRLTTTIAITSFITTILLIVLIILRRSSNFNHSYYSPIEPLEVWALMVRPSTHQSLFPAPKHALLKTLLVPGSPYLRSHKSQMELSSPVEHHCRSLPRVLPPGFLF